MTDKMEKVKKLLHELDKDELYEVANIAYIIVEYLESQKIAA